MVWGIGFRGPIPAYAGMTKGCGNDKKVCHPGGKHHDGKSFCVNVG